MVARGDYLERVARAMSEAELLANVRQLAGVLGWLAYHTHRSDRSEAGFPDLVLVRDGRCVVAELKRQAGRVTGPQQLWLDRLGAVAGVEVVVWRPVDWLDGTVHRKLR